MKVPVGEGVARITGNGADWFGLTVTFAGSRICATFAIFTVALDPTKPGADALIVLLPAFAGVTVTFRVVEPCGTVTVAGTAATPVLLLARFTFWPPGPAA